jgi:8-oxo-dGTP diphosphatase / 2-hydroxy-dATP diphosphatase
MKKLMTLCIIRKENKLLLGMKKRGFGEGRWNGFGGKVDDNETINKSAIRELKEEVGIIAQELEKVGILAFEFENDEKLLEVHVFLVKNFSGDIIETDEMRPGWFDIDNIPFDKMWSDDIFWLPLLLENKKFKGKFLFDKPSNTEYSSKILEKEIFEVKEL